MARLNDTKGVLRMKEPRGECGLLGGFLWPPGRPSPPAYSPDSGAADSWRRERWGPGPGAGEEGLRSATLYLDGGEMRRRAR